MNDQTWRWSKFTKHKTFRVNVSSAPSFTSVVIIIIIDFMKGHLISWFKSLHLLNHILWLNLMRVNLRKEQNPPKRNVAVKRSSSWNHQRFVPFFHTSRTGIHIFHILICIQLPLYGNPYPPKDIIISDEVGSIEGALRTTREALTPYFSMGIDASRRGIEIMETAVAHTKSTYEVIIDESSSIPKAAAITSGGLLGLLLASRRGFFKKILYTGTGLGLSAALCYPKQTGELTELTGYIIRNKGPEVIKEFTGVDVNPYLEKIKKKTPVLKSQVPYDW